MLPKERRVRLAKDHTRLMRIGRTYRSGGISVRIAPNRTNEIRIGVVAGKTFSKKAVARNRIRRQLEEIARLLLKNDRILRGCDILIRPDARVLDAPYAVLQKLADDALMHAGALK